MRLVSGLLRVRGGRLRLLAGDFCRAKAVDRKLNPEMANRRFIEALSCGGRRDGNGAAVRRETDEEYKVKVACGEGYAHHTDPEPCAVGCEIGGEASAG